MVYRVTLEQVKKIKMATAGFTQCPLLLQRPPCRPPATFVVSPIPSPEWGHSLGRPLPPSLPLARIAFPKVEGVDRAPGSWSSQPSSLLGLAECKFLAVCYCVSPAQLGRRVRTGITPRPPSRRRRWTSPSEASASCKVHLPAWRRFYSWVLILDIRRCHRCIFCRRAHFQRKSMCHCWSSG